MSGYRIFVDRDLMTVGRKPTTDEEGVLLDQWEKEGVKPAQAARSILNTRRDAGKVQPPPSAPADRKERLRTVHLNEWERHALIKGVGRLIIDEELAPARARALLDKLLKAREQK